MQSKRDILLRILRECESLLVGYSCGVDSVFLARIAVDTLGAGKVLAVTGRSASLPSWMERTARDVASDFGIPWLEVSTDEIADPRYAANPSNRCYFCKSELWGRLVPVARERGFAAVLDGTNADDRGDYRPGAAAAAEQQVESPLAAVGLAKNEIRALSRRRGLEGWDRPASPCLSSRIPYGTAVTTDRLRRIETAERALRGIGITGDLRVRYHGDLARVELARAELEEWLVPERSRRLRDAVLFAGFTRVAIDLAGFRSGSLNVLSGVTTG